MIRLFRCAVGVVLAATSMAGWAQSPVDLPIFDAHVHYSHDAWASMPPPEAIALLRKAGVRRALVSSSNDEGTQQLAKAAPDLILPSLRPYRTRADVSTWVRDEAIIKYLEARLARYKFVAVGEFHLFGADADLPVPRRMVELARKHALVLHAHSDVDAVERLFKQWPQAKILWAHSGFARPEEVSAMLAKHKNLWADLAFRSDHGSGGQIPAEWRAVFLAHPDRFTVGTDTYTPERWHYVTEHASWTRQWLAGLPRQVAEQIAHKNGERLFAEWIKRSD
jgi:predicted TIM-barrel fold metal-dependent hydrolase